MLFGRPEEFAIEALLEPDSGFGAVQGNHLAGRFCVWIGGAPIGRIEEPSCWFRPFQDHLLSRLGTTHELWNARFAGLGPAEIFDRLDALLYAAHRHELLDLEQDEVPVEFRRFNFLINASEAFDGWKAFLLREPASTELMVLVLPPDTRDVGVYRVPVASFELAIQDFAHWLDEERRRLLPHVPR